MKLKGLTPFFYSFTEWMSAFSNDILDEKGFAVPLAEVCLCLMRDKNDCWKTCWSMFSLKTNPV